MPIKKNPNDNYMDKKNMELEERGEIEFGKCEICGKNKELTRTYFRYDIKCECHSPYHFELVRHCYDCTPIEPTETKITLKTRNIMKLDESELL